MSQKSKYICKSHNVEALLDHSVTRIMYRSFVFTKGVGQVLVSVCSEIKKRDDIRFLEIGTDDDHVLFLLESVPTYNITTIMRVIKSLIAREIF